MLARGTYSLANPPGGQGPPNPPCSQARIARTAREHEMLTVRNMMSNHTDMQDNYCGDCYDTHPLQSQYTKVVACGRLHKRGDAAFGRATSFVVSGFPLYWATCSSPFGLHVPSPFAQCALARKGALGGLAKGTLGCLRLRQGSLGRGWWATQFCTSPN